jgi:hypothetical protein
MPEAVDISVVSNRIREFIDGARVAAADGLTIAEFGDITTDLLRAVVSALDSVEAAGDKKKEWALAAVAALFDAVADKCVPAVLYPVWLLVRSSVRSVLLYYSAGALEVILKLVRGEPEVILKLVRGES